MLELTEEFFRAVWSGVAEEICGYGGSALITVLCMAAAGGILAGIFIDARCAVLYAVTGNHAKTLGSLYIREEKGYLLVKVPDKLLERSDSIYYTMQISPAFTKRHYMEELFLELPGGRRKVAVKRKVRFKCGVVNG